MTLEVAACRLIVDPPAPGAWNMAVDEALLEAVADEAVATLRLYRWSEPTLSLGYFQRLTDRQFHSASRDCAVVRRQTGGGAIVHDRELTYSLTLPPGNRFARDATTLYFAVHEAIRRLLIGRLGSAARDWQLAIHEESSPLLPADEPFLCFQRRARGDMLLVADRGGIQTETGRFTYKLLGSAQRRHRGAILQHGSLLLDTSPAAPELPGWRELTGTAISSDDVAAGLPEQLADVFAIGLEACELPQPVREAARRIERAKYAAPEWTGRR